MTPAFPSISPQLKERMIAIMQHPSVVVDRTYTAMMESDAEYASLTQVVKRDVLESIKTFSSLWFRCIAEERFISSDELEVLAEVGRRRVHQGISLNSLLRAFRSGSREILQVYLDIGRSDESLRDELLFILSPSLLEYVDTASQAIAQAFLDEQFKGSRWRDAMRYELCSIIFNSPNDTESFKRAAAALGIDAHGLRVALAMDMDFSSINPLHIEDAMDRVTLTIARCFKVSADEVIRVMYRGRLMVWIPCARSESILSTNKRISDSIRSIPRAIPKLANIGVGLMNQGAAGWATSAHEAMRALTLGPTADPKACVHSYSTFAISESVTNNATALRYLDSIIQHLAHEPDLIPTLECYFGNAQGRKATAASLGIHPNTLTYRLDRIEALLGTSLSDVDELTKLHIALALRRMSAPQPAGSPPPG